MHPFDDVITFTAPDDSGHFTCEIWSPKGRSLKVFGNLHDPEPTVTGDPELTRNRAIAQNLWTAASEYVQGSPSKRRRIQPTPKTPGKTPLNS